MISLSPEQEARARELHHQSLVWDSHCDTLMDIAASRRHLRETTKKGHLDLPRLVAGGVNVQVFAIYVAGPPYLRQSLEYISAFYRELAANEEGLALVTTTGQAQAVVSRGQVAALLSIEGGEALEGGPEILPSLYTLGVRALGLTWNRRNQLADGVAESRTGGGLTTLGVETVREMNRLGMMVDVSHLAPAGFWDVLEVSSRPVIASHSNAHRIWKHPRNLDDEQIKALAARGGVMGINFAPHFLGPSADLETVLNHIDHIANLAGTGCIGLGSDYDGIRETPRGLEDVSQMPNITRGLVARGYSNDDIKAILGGNFLRVFAEVIG